MSYSASSNQPVAAVPGGGSGSGGPALKIPSYAALEGKNSFSGVSELSMPLDSNGGGYMKRFYNTESDETTSVDNQQQSTKTSDGKDKNPKQ